MKLYIAGGAVRDVILGRPVKDIDFSFGGSEEEFIQSNPQARKVKEHPSPIYILNGSEFSPLAGGDAASDILRRDFTINSMLLEENGIILAHPDSFNDLTKLILRPTSHHSIPGDPIRAFRAARLSAEIPGLALHDETIAQMRSLSLSSLENIAPEQIGRETLKACAAEQPGNFLRSLALGGCLLPWFKEFEWADSIPAGPPAFHKYSILGHTADVMNRTARAAAGTGRKKERTLAVWMALCHDIGKNTTPPEILPKHLDHEKRGESMSLELGGRLRLSSFFIKAGSLSAALHMKAGIYRTLRPGTRVDLLMTAHNAGIMEPLFLVASQDGLKPDLPDLAAKELKLILAVHLPEKWRSKGSKSGRKLRELRCEELARNGIVRMPR